MRTTIRIDDGLLIEAKKRAAEDGTTLTRLIEDALRQRFAQDEDDRPAPVTLPAFRGDGLQPGVDLYDNAALRELMETAGDSPDQF